MTAKHAHAPHFVNGGFFRGLASFSELEQRLSALPSENERGNAFEVFAEAYLATQKIIQASEVWPERSIPLDLLKAHALPHKDLGADGVFKNHSGRLSAYQVKYRSRRKALTWEELGTFMGLTDQVDQRVLFTNSDGLPAVMNDRSNFFCIRGTDLDRLTPEDFLTIDGWLNTGRLVVTRKTPLPHQAEAIRAIVAGLGEQDRATAVMACGTGKTLVALWVAEQMNCRRIVVLVPSLALIRQTLHEWLKETQWKAPRFICVCSDPTVSSGSDELIVRQSDVDFPVTTDSLEVRKFLSDSSGDAQVIFTTYQSSKVVGEAAKDLPPFNLGIFDEAHKTAGREGSNFGFALSDKNLYIDKRLFLTATPRHYDIARRDKEGEAKEVFSMDVPEIYGERIYTLPFAEAARRGIICDYKVIISVITSDMVNDELLRHGEVLVAGDVVRARQVANQIALQKACDEYNLRKVFTFHTRVETAREFTGEGAQSIMSYLPQYRALHVSGDMPTARREMVMKTFKEAERAVISNARCLTEGVDVPAVDMVAFMSPKKSKVDIVQATGRAMRKAPHKTIGYVMVPLYLEIAGGESIEEALSRTDFGEIWDVLQAMREQDEVLEDIIRQLMMNKGRTGNFDGSKTHERIEVLGPEISLDELRRAVAIAIVEKLGASWDERYGQLQRYKEQFGNCNVPRDWSKNPQLANWVGAQRYIKSQGQLEPDRLRRLDDLGFEWDFFQMSWESKFEELTRYKQENGNCNVPKRSTQYKELGTWIAEQRKARNKNKLNPERAKRLEELGLEWDLAATYWENNFTKLVQYKQDYGDCNVPNRWHADPALGTWVGHQRACKSQLRSERVERMDELGFDWDPIETAWEANFAALARFKNEHGHCVVPQKETKYRQLGIWVGEQRRAKKTKILNPDGSRSKMRKNDLEPEKIKRLEELGFDWDPSASNWENNFRDLKLYKEKHGHCNVPQRSTEHLDLGRWVRNQRMDKIDGSLSPERQTRLEGLGFEWDQLASAWEKKFSELQNYKEKHGHCNIPSAWPENPQLATWVGHQRRHKKLGNLDSERVKRLENLGFLWTMKEKPSNS